MFTRTPEDVLVPARLHGAAPGSEWGESMGRSSDLGFDDQEHGTGTTLDADQQGLVGRHLGQ